MKHCQNCNRKIWFWNRSYQEYGYAVDYLGTKYYFCCLACYIGFNKKIAKFKAMKPIFDRRSWKE